MKLNNQMTDQNQKKRPDREYAIKAAESVLEEFKVTRPPVAIDKIARKMGVKLMYSPLDDELSGMVYVKNGDPIIGVNSLHHPNRQRFTIAHEVGHLIMHRHQIEQEVHVDKTFLMLRRDSESSSGVNAIEVEANAFAAEVLMPKILVNNALKNRTFDIDDESLIAQLAKQFKVSTQAIQFRLGRLIG